MVQSRCFESTPAHSIHHQCWSSTTNKIFVTLTHKGEKNKTTHKHHPNSPLGRVRGVLSPDDSTPQTAVRILCAAPHGGALVAPPTSADPSWPMRRTPPLWRTFSSLRVREKEHVGGKRMRGSTLPPGFAGAHTLTVKAACQQHLRANQLFTVGLEQFLRIPQGACGSMQCSLEIPHSQQPSDISLSQLDDGVLHMRGWW